MNDFSEYSLGTFSVGAAGTQTGTAVIGLTSLNAATISAKLWYGSGGTTATVVVQTSLNGGTTWIDVARFDFTTATAEKLLTLSALTPRLTPLVVAPLGAEGAVDGVLGSRFRAVVTSTGTYAGNTTADVRMSIR